jgi:hypothetical protein
VQETKTSKPGKSAGAFRLALCGHKVVEAGAVCAVLMVQGDLASLTLAHLAIATKTGLLAMSPVVGVTFSRYARHLLNRWTAALLFGVSTFAGDALMHPSHYEGALTEAALTGVGAAIFSLVISYTPIGAHLDHLGEVFRHDHQAASVAATIAPDSDAPV